MPPRSAEEERAPPDPTPKSSRSCDDCGDQFNFPAAGGGGGSCRWLDGDAPSKQSCPSLGGGGDAPTGQDSISTLPTFAASEASGGAGSGSSVGINLAAAAASGGLGGSSRASNLWNRLVSRPDVVWDNDEYYDDDLHGAAGLRYDGDASDEERFLDNDVESGDAAAASSRKAAPGLKRRCLSHRRRCSLSAAKFGRTLRRRPLIPLIAAVAFAALCAAGLCAVRSHANGYAQQMKSLAESTAKDCIKFFGDEFDRALLPLFTLAQIAKHDVRFRELAGRIGNRGDPGAAPGWPGRETELRDVRGICDDADLMEYFNGVAESVRRDSGLGAALPNLRLAPMGVMCLVHPIINYDDFPNGTYANVTKRLYNDWATDKPSHIDALEKTLQVQESEDGPRVTISGPFQPKSGAGDGQILTNMLFCPHLGVPVPDHYITVRNRTYESWGFVFGYMNWEYMVEQSDVHERFEELGMVFMLERTSVRMDRENPYTYYEDMHVLAQSKDGCVTNLTESDLIHVQMTVNGDPWTLTAGFTCGFRPPWQTLAEVTVVFVSLVGALLLLLVLVEKAQHKELLYRMMPRSAVRKLNRGQTVVEKYDEPVTVFFSDIVGFTAMAGEMRPVQVMRMLNELYSRFDKLVEKHDLYKVETVADAYMVLGGAPDRLPGSEAARRVALFALDAVQCVRDYRFGDADEQLFVRAGLASGPVAAGVIGTSAPRYCLFGDTCNLASRMESTSERMRIQCSDSTAELLREVAREDGGDAFELVERRAANGRMGVDVKGKGWTRTWWIEGIEEGTAVGAPFTGRKGWRRLFPSHGRRLSDEDLLPQDTCDDKSEEGDKRASLLRTSSKTEVSMLSLDAPPSSEVTKKTGFLPRSLPWRRKSEESVANNDGAASQGGGELRSHGKPPSFRSNKLSWTKILLEANAKAPSSAVAESMSMQHWTCLGHGKDPLNAATDHAGVMIDRMAALMERRLLAVLRSRKAIAGSLPFRAVEELRNYIAEIEGLYNKVHYHSFEHAVHVTTSANKLIEIMLKTRAEDNGGCDETLLYDTLRGDPLAHFALVFAAFVHDVGHHGQSNGMLIKQGHELASKYEGRSVAERNSIDVALSILSKSEYSELRCAAMPTDDDAVTFEQVVRGTILCTDIADKDQMDGCKRRWERAFDEAGLTDGGGVEADCAVDSEHSHGTEVELSPPTRGTLNNEGKEGCARPKCPFPSNGPMACLRSCVILEHMIQIADVAHTMQGWGNFVKWNYRLFRELYTCHRAGLMPDPAPGWADGQVSFLEGYVLPLAERLDQTGALGTHGPRLVRRAMENCARWAEAGSDIAVIMANGIATDEVEERTMQLILLRAFQAGEKSLLWDDFTETVDSNDCEIGRE